jgi:hypothetical protein
MMRAKATVFFQFQPIGLLALILGRVVIPLLTFGASKCNNFPWHDFILTRLQFSAFSAQPTPTGFALAAILRLKR